jgi:hypothetical protein
MNNADRENGTMAGRVVFTVPAYGFVMALYLDWLRRTVTETSKIFHFFSLILTLGPQKFVCRA